MPTPFCATPDVEDSRSASAIVKDAITGSHLLHVEGYSRTKGVPNGRFIKSRPFKVGGFSWCVSYYPNGARPNLADCISVFLTLDETVAQTVKAQAKFSLLNQVSRTGPSHTLTTLLREYSNHACGYGFDDFIKREFLEKSEYLKDDSIKIKCDVFISKKIHTETGLLHLHSSWSRRLTCTCISVISLQPKMVQMSNSSSGVQDLATLHLQRLAARDGGEEEALMAQHLLEAADRYDRQRLKLICEDKLCNHLEVSTVATTLALAEQHSCQGLKEACIEFLISPDALEAVMATDGFEHLTKSCPALVKELMSKLGTRLYKRRKLRA
ncbi:BTB/POZ and MATH domain-containing protein 2-like [Panicum miliaceum]|uniref:BTB/POZ and MATH domain-containing protein 2-like n=1 Tax=Panicum miliaceum TaxID=4540 RepID=A0A3L6PCR3_PANMI|nr:BTB/POZ and MATH domain-containing protein 2-like [Panicum miliaceum]